VGSDDCHGRALWGLGYVLSSGPPAFGPLAKACFDRAVQGLGELNLRGAAYALLGLHYYQEAYTGALEIRAWMSRLGQQLADRYRSTAGDSWRWFEPILTYDNGVIPQALWLAARHLNNPQWYEIAQESADFLFEKTTRQGRISLVGNEGWQQKGAEEKAHFDQQPIDACRLVELAKVAYRLTKKPEYLRRMQRAFDWFMGDNDVGVPLYDPTTGGCFDGLQPDGVSQNQGAESSLSYLTALLTLTEVSPQDEEHEIRRARTAQTRGAPVRTGDTGIPT
jgi:hypothetical protein